tara:strand:- start:1797 stop:3071 length:1275 start_codon:yes stop_codon:yes gene_type:complete
MKIGVLLGRGVEGVGLTKNVVEFQKLYPEVEIYATIDKLWQRMNSMDFKVNYFRGADWNEISKPTKKFPDLLTCTQVIDRINKLDMCIVYSVPSKSHPEDCINNFIKMMDEIKVRKSLVQVDHKIHSINRNAGLAEISSKMNVLMCHYTENPFGKWVKKNNIETPLTNMGVGFNFNKDYWKPIEQQNPNLVRWVGRTAMWKGPDIMIDFHNDHLRKNNFITMLEGLEASINYPAVLYKNPKELTGRRDVINYFRPEKGIDINESKNPEYGTEEINKGAYLYGAYTHSEMMERMSLGGFGSDLMYFNENIYGDNVEYCHTDCFAAGVIPIFHKHFCDNVIHKKQGKPISECKDTGTLGVDAENAETVCSQMIILSNDNVMRDEWRNMMFEFWKDHCDSSIIYKDIINKTLNYNEKNVATLEDFFV